MEKLEIIYSEINARYVETKAKNGRPANGLTEVPMPTISFVYELLTQADSVIPGMSGVTHRIRDKFGKSISSARAGKLMRMINERLELGLTESKSSSQSRNRKDRVPKSNEPDLSYNKLLNSIFGGGNVKV